MNFVVRFLKEDEIGMVKSLFCICFGSEMAEAHIFFRPQQKMIIGAFNGDTLCSMMTVFDCEAVLADRVVSAGYIAGVATAPEYRGNRLFRQCFDFFCATKHNYKLLFCIPATSSLFPLYNSVGMDKTTYIKQSHFIGCGDNKGIEGIETTIPFKRLSDINAEKMLVIKKTQDLLAATAEAFVYYGGKIIQDESFVAFVYENDEEVTVANICTNDYNAALRQVLKKVEIGKKVRIILPNNQYTAGIEGEEIPIAACMVLEDKLELQGLYINMLFNDI